MFRTTRPIRVTGILNNDRTNGFEAGEVTFSYTLVAWCETAGFEEVESGDHGEEGDLLGVSK